ncbi:MAG: transcription antitermination factor NusB [Vicinamibacterales bacterium]
MTTARHRAREAALQAFYFWEVGRVEPGQALGAVLREHADELDDAGRAFVTRLVEGTIGELLAIDRTIEAHARHWRLDRMAVVDRIVLRLATWELRHEADTPPPVVIDEALELARTFGSDDSPRFVNGVLDAIRRTLEQEGHVERS